MSPQKWNIGGDSWKKNFRRLAPKLSPQTLLQVYATVSNASEVSDTWNKSKVDWDCMWMLVSWNSCENKLDLRVRMQNSASSNQWDWWTRWPSSQNLFGEILVHGILVNVSKHSILEMVLARSRANPRLDTSHHTELDWSFFHMKQLLEALRGKASATCVSVD